MKILPFLCLLACAHATQPISQAPDLSSFIAEVTQEPADPSCPGVIELVGPIDDPSEFVNALSRCRHKSVVVEINSPGGSVFGALEMQKAIERHPHPVVCFVDGMAASAAFITLQSCDVRLMSERSILMTHTAAAGVSGHAEAHENMAKVLRDLDRAIALKISRRMGMPVEEYEAKVSGGLEWWMGVEEAQQVNAIDGWCASLKDAEKIATVGLEK